MKSSNLKGLLHVAGIPSLRVPKLTASSLFNVLKQSAAAANHKQVRSTGEKTQIEKVAKLVKEVGGEIYHVDAEDGMTVVFVDDGFWCVYITDEKPWEIHLHFRRIVDPYVAAIVAQRLERLMASSGMEVVVGESYAPKLDENGNVTGLVYGIEATKLVREDFVRGEDS